ncbi:MAG TPA: hypothetical protein VLS90_14455, partial [Thermodesulfobacteriota bacterium]|nr:hypothetical protein [Thermodesulfobacteriota bacterium]
PIGATRILRSFAKNTVAAVLMGGAAYWVSLGASWEEAGFTPQKVFILVLAISAAVIVYGSACYLLRSDEIHSATALVLKKIGKSSSPSRDRFRR